MPNVHTLAEVKSRYGEKVFETGTSFGVNDYGKYRPNITFVLPKDYDGDPLCYRSDKPSREMIAGLGIDFGTSESGVSVLFGDFWLSDRNKPHFEPQLHEIADHVLVRAAWGGFDHPGTRGRWDAPKWATYFRRAASNGGGQGYDYYVLPVGFYLVVRDEELDGAQVVTPDFAARAAQVRAAFEQYDRAQTEERAAKAQAKVGAEAMSRLARASFLPRLEALQPRLAVLQADSPRTTYGELELHEVRFNLGYTQRDALYNEENVVQAERNVAYWYEQSAKRKQRAEMIPVFEKFAARVAALGLSLSFGDEKVNWSGGSYYGGFTYDQEGLATLEADLIRKEEEVAERARKETAAAAKAEIEALAKTLGLPSDVRIWRRMGGANNRGNGWVIRPDGTKREHDPSSLSRYGDGDLVWNQILPGELVLRYSQGSRYDIAHCEVVHRPETVTSAQLATVRQLEEELEASENAFGLDQRLATLIDRRKVAIEEAIDSLPSALRPESWDYQVLVSANGVALGVSGDGWVDNSTPFETSCEGREAQVVYAHPAADGVLEALAYYKWGCWNLNLRWREDASVRPGTAVTEADEDAAPADEGLAYADALAELLKKFGGR